MNRRKFLPASAGPDDDVVVCENYKTCKTRPVLVDDVDWDEPPHCGERLPMETEIKFRDWPHRWQ